MSHVLKIRQAGNRDCPSIARILHEASQNLDPNRECGLEFVRTFYLIHPEQVSLMLAEKNGQIVGFQSLKKVGVANIYDVLDGWGVVGTYVLPEASRMGVGQALWDKTRAQATHHKMTAIDASTLTTNLGAIAYYRSLGFAPYLYPKNRIRMIYAF